MFECLVLTHQNTAKDSAFGKKNNKEKQQYCVTEAFCELFVSQFEHDVFWLGWTALSTDEDCN